jgi:glycosyltransferase involved in cell wall biosynthesis
MKKKILYLHQYFKFPYDSGGTRSYDLARSFVGEGFDVEIVSSTTNERYKDRKGWFTVEEDGLKVHYIYIDYSNSSSRIQRIKAFLKFVYHSSKKTLKLDKDLLLATSTPLTIGIPAMINKWIKKTPYIFEVRDVWPEAVIAIGAIRNKFLQKLLISLEKKIYKNAAAVVPLSTDMKKSIVGRYPRFADKVGDVIENIAEVNRFQEQIDPGLSILDNHGIPSGRFSILYAGTFGRVNGLKYVVSLAEATSKLNDRIIYILIGNGAEKEEITRLLESKQLLNKTVYLLPPVPKSKLPQLYHEVSMGSSFVIPVKELWANSANKFFDTLAAGKPVLINYGGWQKAVITEENAGYVLPAVLNDEAVSDFVAYAADTELHSLQRNNALNTAVKRYSLEVLAAKYITIFNSVLSGAK